MPDKKRTILTAFATALLASCTQENFVPQDGDLLFCASGNIEWAQMWKYLLAMFVIIWGLEMMSGKNLKDRSVV